MLKYICQRIKQFENPLDDIGGLNDIQRYSSSLILGIELGTISYKEEMELTPDGKCTVTKITITEPRGKV